MEKRYCEGCEERIPEGRLKARPQATLCIRCQEREEIEGRFSKHRMGFNVRTINTEEIEMESYLVRGTI